MLKLLVAMLSLSAAEPVPAAQEPLVIGTTYRLQSEVYGEERRVNVYAPEVPAWTFGPLPVLFLIDGGREQDFLHVAGLSQLALITRERQPVIVVGIRTRNRESELSFQPTDPRYAPALEKGAGGAPIFQRFLEQEVIPFIEARYATGRRAVAGQDLAGLFIMDVFLRHPSLFHDYIAVSPSLWYDDRKLAREAPGLLETWDAEVRRLYVTMADAGGTAQLGLDEVLAALQSTQPEGLLWHYADRRDEDLEGTLFHEGVRGAFEWLYGTSDPEYPEEPWYLRVGGEPEPLD